ncbi:GDSL esterase/lipase [Melia azedarach]|uniref:GDSL esterase/lipase n=1 Tax=Melia azedarach TaxID=155640 RepID=A0ACC1Y2J5_MELAZ|nr:GDSL esterase/lipase [Melia azedarach]
MIRSEFLVCFLILFSSLLIPSHGHRALPEKQAALFIFGDSLFDAGNNNHINTTIDYQANFFPYGETFFKYATGRHSDGRLIPDFIAEYAKLPLIPTFLPSTSHEFTFGVNFASAGAGALVETHKGFVIDLKTQISYFKIVQKELKQKLGDERTKTLLSRAVYLFSIGSNDYIVPLLANSSVLHSDYSRKQYVATVIGNLTATIKDIYKKGGRKFGFVNLGQMGCFPASRLFVAGRTGACLEDASELAKLHNKALSEVLQELESQLKGFKYANHDFYNSGAELFSNPSKYGFKKTTACCGSGPFRGFPSCGGKRSGLKDYELCDNPDEYLFFDFSHPSEKANKQISELMWSGTPDVTGPYNFKTLFELK